MKTTGIQTDYIKLDALLKFAALVASGGEAKTAVAEGLVKVNGELCTERGRKLRDGDTFSFGAESVEIRRIDVHES